MIYISPVTINDETLQYYNKLLGLQSAVQSGDVENQEDLSARFKIIVPEAINSFPVSSLGSYIVTNKLGCKSKRTCPEIRKWNIFHTIFCN